MRVFEMPAFAAYDQLSTEVPDTRPSFTWRRTEGLTGAKDCHVANSVSAASNKWCLDDFGLHVSFHICSVIKQAKSCNVWVRRKCCGVASTRRLAALEAFPADYYTDGWTWVPTLRLLCSTLITDTTQHSCWTRRRALATFYPGWDLGGNNNLGNRLSEVTDQHNTPKRTFVRLGRLRCLFKKKIISVPFS